MWSQETISDCEGAIIQKKQLKRLQSKSRRTDATVWIGKQGATDKVVNQVSSQLRARELVKLKVHKSALSETKTSTLAETVAASTGSVLVEVMGHTFTLYKRREVVKPKEVGNVGRSKRVN